MSIDVWSSCCPLCDMQLPYSRKYWWSKNSAVWPPKRYVVMLTEFKFGRFIDFSPMAPMSANILAGLKFGGSEKDRQTAKFNSPPNFPAIRYFVIYSTLFDYSQWVATTQG